MSKDPGFAVLCRIRLEPCWNRVDASGMVEKYGVKIFDIEVQAWRTRDFWLADPSGVLWRIGQNIE